MLFTPACSQLDPSLEAKVNAQKQSVMLEGEYEVSGGGSGDEATPTESFDSRKSSVSSQEAANPKQMRSSGFSIKIKSKKLMLKKIVYKVVVKKVQIS